jgi:hypothetical protein
MSGWCLLTGVEVAISKFRTFGMEWGVKKLGERKHIEILMKGKIKKKIEVKGEEIMTHLGVTWNMDLNGEKQWDDINDTIKRIEEEVNSWHLP